MSESMYIYIFPHHFSFFISRYMYIYLQSQKAIMWKAKKCFIQLDSWAIYITIPIKYN